MAAQDVLFRMMAVRIVLISLVLVPLAGLILHIMCARAHTNVTPLEAKSMIDSSDQLIVLDVREVHEYRSSVGHIPGALNYPWSSGVLQSRYEELPKNSPILLVCRLGRRSNRAANFFGSKGYPYVFDMLGGMSAWRWETVLYVNSDDDVLNDDLDNFPGAYNSSQDDSE